MKIRTRLVLLLACLLVSIGVLASSLTANQVVAAALAIGASLMLWFADAATGVLPPAWQPAAVNLSLIGHFKPMATGSVFLSDIMYFCSLTLACLWLACRRLADR